MGKRTPALLVAWIFLSAARPANCAGIEVAVRDGTLTLGRSGAVFAQLVRVSAALGSGPARDVAFRSFRRDESGSLRLFYGDESFGVDLAVASMGPEPLARVRIGVTSASPVTADVEILLSRVAKEPASSVLCFTVQNRFTVQPLRQDLPDGTSFSAGFGVTGFFPSPPRLTMYLPVYSVGEQPALVVMCDPRTAFRFETSRTQTRVSRRFYPGAGPAAADRSLDLGPRLGRAYHDLYIGAARKPAWDDLVWDFYAAAFPSAMSGPTVDRGPFLTASLGKYRFSERWLARLYSYGGRIVGLASAGTRDDYARKENLLDVKLVHSAGLSATTGVDRYTRDLEQERSYGWENAAEPGLLWQNVRDALILSPDGQPQKVWSGMAVNMSPEFSYGRTLLRILKEKVEKHGFDGVFIDYYLDGDGADPTRHYGSYPFYPTIAADAQFLGDLSEWLHSRGKMLILNCVAPGVIPLLQFADAHACDCQPDLFLQWKLVTGRKPLASYGGSTFPENAFTTRGWLANGFSALFYGAASPAWAYGPEGPDAIVANVHYLLDPEIGQPMFARNSYFGRALGLALLVGGDAEGGTSLFFRSEEGMFLAHRNRTDKPEVRLADFAHARLKLDPKAWYTLFRWDPDRGASLINQRVRGAQLLKPSRLALQPGQVSFLCAVPCTKAVRRDYAAFPGQGLPYIASATDRITQISRRRDGSLWFAMAGLPKVMAEVRVGLPAGWRPGSVTVNGSEEHSVQVSDRNLIISGRLSGPMRVLLTPAGKEQTPLKPGTVLRSRRPQKDIPLGTWQPESGSWDVGDRSVALREPSPTPSAVRLANPLPPEYTLEFDVTRTSADPTPWPKVEVLLGAAGSEQISVCWDSKFSLMANHERELAAGIDTAMHPNRYTKLIRTYRLRIEKATKTCRVFLSYNKGLSYEDVAAFALPDDLQNRLGLALTYTAGHFDNIRLSSAASATRPAALRSGADVR